MITFAIFLLFAFTVNGKDNTCPLGIDIVPGETCGGFVGEKCPNGSFCVYPEGSSLGFCCKSPCPDGSVLLREVCGGFLDAKCPEGAVCVFNPMSVVDVPNFCCGCQDTSTKVCPNGEVVRRNPEKHCEYDECPDRGCRGVCLGDTCGDGWYCNWPKYHLVGFCCPMVCDNPRGTQRCRDSSDCSRKYYCLKKVGSITGHCCKNPCFKGKPQSIGCSIIDLDPPCPRKYVCNEMAFGGMGACCKKCKQSDKYKTTICIKDDCITGTCEEIAAKSMKFKKKLCRKDKKGKCCKTCGAS